MLIKIQPRNLGRLRYRQQMLVNNWLVEIGPQLAVYLLAVLTKMARINEPII